MNLNLIMAAFWAAIGTILLLARSAQENPLFFFSAEHQDLMCGFAWLLVGWNIVRCIARLIVRRREGRLRRLDEEEARRERAALRRRHYEPPNPDFDFSDPKPEMPPKPPGPGNGSG
jgi:hypothetical protein